MDHFKSAECQSGQCFLIRGSLRWPLGTGKEPANPSSAGRAFSQMYMECGWIGSPLGTGLDKLTSSLEYLLY